MRKMYDRTLKREKVKKREKKCLDMHTHTFGLVHVWCFLDTMLSGGWW